MRTYRLILFCTVACLAIYVGRFHFETEAAARLVGKWGYWMIALPFVMFAVALWRVVAPVVRRRLGEVVRSPTRLRKVVLSALFLVSLFGVLWQSQEKGWKVVMDEPVIASTALSMHENRETFYSISGYRLEGEYFASTFAVDKRPLFFPFLVSLLHDWTGYRPYQAVWLNGLLLAVFLGLVFLIGREVLPPFGGYVLAGLLATVPIFPIVATSGIFDLLNAVMILIVAIAMYAYLKKPGSDRMNLMLLAAVLLAHTRYESVLFVFPVGGVILWTWWRQRFVDLSATMILTPFLLVPYLLQRQITDASPGNWHFRGADSVAFGLDYLGENLRQAFRYFFETGTAMPNSHLLTCLFFAAFVCVLLLLTRLLSPEAARHALIVTGAVGAIIVMNLAILMFYHWGQLSNPVASRLVIPFLVLQAVICVVGIRVLRGGRNFQLTLLGIIALFFLTSTRPSLARGEYFSWAASRSYCEEVLRFAWHEAEDNDLIITSNSLPAYLGRISTLGIDSAVKQLDRIALHQALRTFGNVYVIYAVPTPLADIEKVPELEGYRDDQSLFEASFEMKGLRRKKLNDTLYLIQAEVVRVREGSYMPMDIDFGGISVNRLGRLIPDDTEVWKRFSESIPK